MLNTIAAWILCFNSQSNLSQVDHDVSYTYNIKSGWDLTS